MARPGDALLPPTNGQRLVFRRTTAQTHGHLLELEVDYTPRETRPEEHVHEAQEQQVEILSGALRVVLNGRLQRLGPGDVLMIPAGATHAIWNACASPARAVWHTYPALDTES